MYESFINDQFCIAMLDFRRVDVKVAKVVARLYKPWFIEFIAHVGC